NAMPLQLTQYQIDAFAQTIFGGNPAAVCRLDRWLDDGLMQAIAAENNLSETAFFVPAGDKFELRWFTPVAEVDLCGHATLACGFVLFEVLGYAKPQIIFSTRSGDLVITKRGSEFAMEFPARVPQPCLAPQALVDGLGLEPVATLRADDYIAVLHDEDQVRK